MRTTRRRVDPGLIEQLLDTPWRFEFFQSVRLLERCFDSGSPNTAALPAQLRFRNTVSLGFAPSQIESISAVGEGAHAPTGRATLSAVDITPCFIGLLGGQGALPVHYTEHVVDQERSRRNSAPRAFFDLFSSRSVAQFYLAWRKYKPALLYERDRRNHFLPQILALCGFGQEGVRDRLADDAGAIDDEVLAYFAGLLRQRPVSACAMERVLATYFRVPVRLEQFVGKWYRLSEVQCSTLGCSNTGLGTDALLGGRVWQCNLRVRVFIGPLADRQYQSFLPGSGQAAALGKLLGLLTGPAFEYEIRPILRAADVRGCRLESNPRSRLGFDSFLCSLPAATDRSDPAFEIPPSH